MASVTQIINGIPHVLTPAKQPYGGYLNPRSFTVTSISDDGKLLDESESISAGTMGIIVDYLTRYMSGASAKEAFKISLYGAYLLEQNGHKGEFKQAKKFLKNLNTSLSDDVINNACWLANYDSVFRAGAGLPGSTLLFKDYNSLQRENSQNFSLRDDS